MSGEESLEEMTVKEIKAFAEFRGIDIPSRVRRKADIIAYVEEALAEEGVEPEDVPLPDVPEVTGEKPKRPMACPVCGCRRFNKAGHCTECGWGSY